jgi:hypothetical protein
MPSHFSIQSMICFSSAFVPLFQILGHRLEIRSQFGKGLLYVAGRVCELQTFEVEKRTRRSGTGFLLRPKDSALLRI